MKKLVTILAFIFIALLGFEFSWSIYSSTEEAKAELWAHRTNNEHRFARALSSDSSGIEIDVYFESDAFEIKHSRKDPIDLDFIPVVGQACGAAKKIWIDLKNLDDANYTTVKKELEKISSCEIYLESTNIQLLAQMRSDKFQRIAWITPKNTRLKIYLDSLKNRALIMMGQIERISFDYTTHSGLVRLLYRGIDQHLFTINNQKAIMEKSKLKETRVILTDIF